MYTDWCYPMFILLVPSIPSFLPVPICEEKFLKKLEFFIFTLATKTSIIFQTSVPNDPKWPHTWDITPPSQISIRLGLKCQPLSSYRPFQTTSASNDPQMILNTKRSRVPICIWLSSLSPKFQFFSSPPWQPAVFELMAILRQVHRSTLKWPWALIGQR